MKKPIPIIFDTDIGSDIDDNWALVMALKSPEIDIRLVTTNEYDTVYKTKLVCKTLEIADARTYRWVSALSAPKATIMKQSG